MARKLHVTDEPETKAKPKTVLVDDNPIAAVACDGFALSLDDRPLQIRCPKCVARSGSACKRTFKNDTAYPLYCWDRIRLAKAVQKIKDAAK